MFKLIGEENVNNFTQFDRVVCLTSKPAHKRSLIRAFASSLNILWLRPLTKNHLEFLSLKGGCRGSSESTLVKMRILLDITCLGSFV